MARKRMIDPGIWQSEQIARLTRDQRLLFIGMFSNADDEGRLKGSPKFLKMAIFPGDEDITSADIREWRDAIANTRDGKGQAPIRVYSVGDEEYIDLPNWKRWQKIDKAYASVLPAFGDHSTSDSRTVDEEATSIPPKEKRIEEKEENRTRAAAADAPPPEPLPIPKRPRTNSKADRIARVADAFRSIGQRFPALTPQDAKAAGVLLDAGYSPEQLAEAWRDIKQARYLPGDGFAASQLSFQFLAGYNRMGNWQDWVDAGRPTPDRANGKAATVPSKSAPVYTGRN